MNDINLINLKDIYYKKNNIENIENKDLLNYAINEVFNIHLEASKTNWSRKLFEDELKKENSVFLLSYYNNNNNLKEFNLNSNITGLIIFYFVLDEMHILDITISKAMQSRGIGSYLLNYTIYKFADKNIKLIFLEVRVSNSRAINLYKKLGFKTFMVRKNYYDDNGENALCMVKELTDFELFT
jgi:ribosomal-protein-alanine N-acetyltransferase